MFITFDAPLFMELPSALECKTLSSFLRPLNISGKVWRYWSMVLDLPLCKMLYICRHYGYDPSLFFVCNDTVLHERQSKPLFRYRLFADVLTIYRNKTVTQACNELGISTCTFARQLRPTNKNGTPSISVRKYLEWCAKADLNPMDFIYEGNVMIMVNY